MEVENGVKNPLHFSLRSGNDPVGLGKCKLYFTDKTYIGMPVPFYISDQTMVSLSLFKKS